VAAGECDLADTCTGTSATCPADVKKTLGTACTADTNPCTLDQCDGTSNACQHPAGNAGATCRAVAGPCDVAETCTGTSTTCPANGFLSASTACRAAANECDVEETCPGAFIIGFRGAVSASSGTASSATSLSISRPAATQANDVMVASITAHDGSGMSGAPPTINPPAGWTLILNT